MAGTRSFSILQRGADEAARAARGEDQSHVVTYDLYFTYGRLTSTERREETYPHVPPRPALKDTSPIGETTVGALTLRLPASIALRPASQQGEIWVVHVAYDGYLNAREDEYGVVLRGRTIPTGDEPIVDTEGTIENTEGLAVTVLAEAHRPDGSLVLVLALE